MGDYIMGTMKDWQIKIMNRDIEEHQSKYCCNCRITMKCDNNNVLDCIQCVDAEGHILERGL